MTLPSRRREMAEKAAAKHAIGMALACRPFEVSATGHRYSPRLGDENQEIADLLTGLTNARKTWGFGRCFLHLRNLQGDVWNHKRLYRICCERALTLRIKPRKRRNGTNPTPWRCRMRPI